MAHLHALCAGGRATLRTSTTHTDAAEVPSVRRLMLLMQFGAALCLLRVVTLRRRVCLMTLSADFASAIAERNRFGVRLQPAFFVRIF